MGNEKNERRLNEKDQEKGRKEERLKGVFGKEIRGKSKRKEKIRIASKSRSEREGKNR